MLNQESNEFAAQLESPDDYSLKDMCHLGAVARKAKSKVVAKKAVTKKGFLDNLFSLGERAIGKAEKIAGQAAKVVGRVSQISAKYGGSVPLDKEIAKLDGMKKELRAAIIEAGGQQVSINTLLRLKNPRADLAAKQLAQAAKAVKDQAETVLKHVDRAQAAAQAARRKILSGQLPTQEMFNYKALMNTVNSTFQTARLRRLELKPIYDKAYSEVVLKPAKVGPGDYARAAGGSLIEFGRQAGSAAQQAGEMVKETGRGIKEATPLLRYLPYIAVAAAAAYAYQFLPKASSSKE